MELRTVGPGGLIVAGPVVIIDASRAAAVVDLLGLEEEGVRRRLHGRDPLADDALAALVGLARTVERSADREMCSGGEAMCSADVPTAGGGLASGGESTVMVTAADDLDVIATAAELGVGSRAVRGLAERRTLPGRKVAGEWRFDRADVERLAARRAQRRET